MSDNATELELWQQMLDGDEEALAALFQCFYQVLYDYGIKFCGRKEIVRDCIQDSFIYIWEKRRNLSPVNSVRAYMLTAFRRNLLRTLNKTRAVEHTHQEITENLEDIGFSPEELLISAETALHQRNMLKHALNEMPPRMREALYLKTFNALSYQEISDIMDISNQVTRNYVSEALKRLRLLTKKKI